MSPNTKLRLEVHYSLPKIPNLERTYSDITTQINLKFVLNALKSLLHKVKPFCSALVSGAVFGVTPMGTSLGVYQMVGCFQRSYSAFNGFRGNFDT